MVPRIGTNSFIAKENKCFYCMKTKCFMPIKRKVHCVETNRFPMLKQTVLYVGTKCSTVRNKVFTVG